MQQQASSLTPLETGPGAHRTGWRAASLGAIDGAAFTIPLSLGAVTLIFSRVGQQALAAAVFATLLSLAVLHLMTLPARRPVLYSARFFEATTLTAMLEHLITRLPGWSIPDTPGVRLALLCLVGGGAGLFVGVLYVLRADRFTRFIPGPVFVGFANGIAIVLLMIQARNVLAMLGEGPAVAVLMISGVCLACSFAIRRWAPRWPAAATALTLGLLLGLAWQAAGHALPMLGEQGFDMQLPLLLADFRPFAAAGVPHSAIGWVLAGNAAVLGTMMFLNTTLSAQLLSHADDRPREGRLALAWSSMWLALAGFIGSAPLSGSIQSSLAASRQARITLVTLAVTVAIMLAVATSGVAAWVPLTAVAGTLAAEGWFMVDRPSARTLLKWLRRQPLSTNSREDLAVVAAVTATAVLVNMVAAVFAGLLLGLLLFAVRNARRPVREVWTGLELSSNCARGRADLRVLAQHGAHLKVVEFERDLFFGAVDSLERTLLALLPDAECIVLNWSSVRHIDSTAARSVEKVERAAHAQGVAVYHVEPEIGSEVHAALAQYLPLRTGAPDLDHALELAENQVLAANAPGLSPDGTTLNEATPLLQGLDEAQRGRLLDAMEQRVIARGEALVRAGELSAELLVVLQGSASVLLPHPGAEPIRVAGVRRGATVGEMGFLDGSVRSAHVIAEEETLVAVLTRAAFDRLGEADPALARRVLTNISIDMAARLRHSNRAASARLARR